MAFSTAASLLEKMPLVSPLALEFTLISLAQLALTLAVNLIWKLRRASTFDSMERT